MKENTYKDFEKKHKTIVRKTRFNKLVWDFKGEKRTITHSELSRFKRHRLDLNRVLELVSEHNNISVNKVIQKIKLEEKEKTIIVNDLIEIKDYNDFLFREETGRYYFEITGRKAGLLLKNNNRKIIDAGSNTFIEVLDMYVENSRLYVKLGDIVDIL